ncbi:hypothetical protein KJI95_15230 [Shewanella sp. JM162201]|uniref:Lipoprotein n=1 Tax=Shewanella jiangmenensis TaxID=2837387 RepID=A0ABS5V9Z6_9GAMM|nr:hypothetical protein [Shewanella jiangmenensis]MBT1445858.1 hypothetical protein [Shewanella jiangmenensis]
MTAAFKLSARLIQSLILLGVAGTLLGACSSTHSPEVGNWQLTLEGYCTERYEFHADGTMVLYSPPELSKARYSLESADEPGFYKLSFFITEHNGEPSCYGESGGGVGFENAFYLRFEDANKVMRLFSAPDLNSPSGAFLTREH